MRLTLVLLFAIFHLNTVLSQANVVFNLYQNEMNSNILPSYKTAVNILYDGVLRELLSIDAQAVVTYNQPDIARIVSRLICAVEHVHQQFQRADTFNDNVRQQTDRLYQTMFVTMNIQQNEFDTQQQQSHGADEVLVKSKKLTDLSSRIVIGRSDPNYIQLEMDLKSLELQLDSQRNAMVNNVKVLEKSLAAYKVEVNTTASIRQQLNLAGVQFGSVLSKTTALKRAIDDVRDFTTLEQPLRDLYHALEENSIAIAFDSSLKPPDNIKEELKNLNQILPLVPLHTDPNALRVSLRCPLPPYLIAMLNSIGLAHWFDVRQTIG
ncbi:unnamed protein product [Didymodactylos carnosus]|uniref:Uncharacterized protein n=1 Tax=Didymodactylos carnosus TaxID=1234261 RepID=A0A815VUA7_9BILA|nr:unnamed protein product [Didymodactylos carnosus]CAF1533349.1 unnamed protein product [Didymodactylos carnosus]CAF4206648.1 unnamed protein product [Didymodactylos carnosus]CAF4392822.1 unnamed protein product [Didymodactylos carnosus]